MALLACTLLACADIAGIGEGGQEIQKGTSSGALPSRNTQDAADKAKDKNNTDNNAVDIDVTPATLDFGGVSCGEQMTVNLVIANRSDEPRPYSIVMPEGVLFRALEPLTGMLPASGTFVVPVEVKPSTSGETKANVVVTSGSSFVTVPVRVLGQGGALDWSTSTADIGDTPYDSSGTTKVKLKNVGTGPATITGFEGQTADLFAGPSPFSPVTLAAGKEQELELTLKKGAPTSKLTATIKPIASGLCTASPSVIVTGKRIDTKVTVTGADWGKQRCNSTPADTNVIVRNYWNKAVKWTVTKKPTLFALQGPETGTVPAATAASVAAGAPGQVSIPFRASNLGATPGLITDSVTVLIESANATDALPPNTGGEQTVAVRVDVRGAVVAISPTDLAFVASKGSVAYKSFKIANTGNEAASLAWTFVRTDGAPAWIGLPQTTYTYGTSQTNVTVGYQPTVDPESVDSPNTATLTPAARSDGSTICNPDALVAVKLSGNK